MIKTYRVVEYRLKDGRMIQHQTIKTGLTSVKALSLRDKLEEKREKDMLNSNSDSNDVSMYCFIVKFDTEKSLEIET